MDREDLILDALHRLEVKVDATNGRVRAMELWRAEMRGASWGIATVVSLAVSLIAAGLTWLLK